jgi:hypothetical protein
MTTSFDSVFTPREVTQKEGYFTHRNSQSLCLENGHGANIATWKGSHEKSAMAPMLG